jgi:hypothetical protein
MSDGLQLWQEKGRGVGVLHGGTGAYRQATERDGHDFGWFFERFEDEDRYDGQLIAHDSKAISQFRL